MHNKNEWRFKDGSRVNWFNRKSKIGNGKVKSIMCSTPKSCNDSIREQFFNNLLGEQINKEELERMIENSYARKHHLIFKKAVDKCREALNELDNKIIEDIKKEQQNEK